MNLAKGFTILVLLEMMQDPINTLPELLFFFV
jgi:hypothetical protein